MAAVDDAEIEYIAMDGVESPEKTTFCEKRLMKALHDGYCGTSGKYLNFLKGDLFEVEKISSSKFLWATSMTSGKRGLIPRKSFEEVEYLHHKSWFFGQITRKEAEGLLLLPINTNRSFLIRNSNGYPGISQYALSVRVPYGQVVHVRILRNKEGHYYIEGCSQFRTLEELVNFYQNVSTNHKGFLGQPCREVEESDLEMYLWTKPKQSTMTSSCCISRKFQMPTKSGSLDRFQYEEAFEPVELLSTSAYMKF